MKRLITILAILATGVVGAMAQQAVAVLTHAGTTKTFDGYTALQDAYKEAASGDLITLSSGTFASVATIEKALTIRGAGMEYDSIYHTQATILQGNFTLALPDTETERFQLEGIYTQNDLIYNYIQRNPSFVKCRIGHVMWGGYSVLGTDYTGRMIDGTFLQCKIVGRIRCNENSSISILNSYVASTFCASSQTSCFFLKNCVVRSGYYNGYANAYNSTFVNCIFVHSDNFNYNDETCFINCLMWSGFTPDTSRSTYQNYDKIQVVFDTYTGTYTDDEDFKMRDEMKSVYCDENGKELGMYGGNFPYTPRLAGPHLKFFDAASHSTSDGKLRVRVQVDTTLE